MKYDDGCGRYALAADSEQLKERYNLATKPPEFPNGFDLKPGQTLPVVAVSEAGKPQFEMMRWGLVPSWWKQDEKIGYKTFNARDDKVFSSGLWRAIYRHRLLVPATGYFEWTKPEKGSDVPKQKFYFHPKGTDIFSFAGFYDVWKDAGKLEWRTYTLITTEPNKEAKAIHDRMPVVLRPEDEAAWLDPACTKREDIAPFLVPFADKSLEVVEVAADTREYPADDERIIAPLNSR